MVVLLGCNRILIAHNHPSGELKFSTADGKFTTRMAEAGDILGFDLLDHLVVTLDGWKSYSTYGKWSKPK